jgi:hypothetical protein
VEVVMMFPAVLSCDCCRCTDLAGFADSALKLCLKAASYKLLYPGTLPSGAEGTGEGSGGSSKAQQIKDTQQTDSSSSSDSSSVGHPNDLASLHSKFQDSRGKVENMLSRSVVSEGGWGFAEQALAVVGVLAIVMFLYGRVKKLRRKGKDHRSE